MSNTLHTELADKMGKAISLKIEKEASEGIQIFTLGIEETSDLCAKIALDHLVNQNIISWVEKLKELPLKEKYLWNQEMLPQGSCPEYMDAKDWQSFTDVYEQAEKEIVFANFFLEYDSCDCGNGYGCSHGSWVHNIKIENYPTLEFENDGGQWLFFIGEKSFHIPEKSSTLYDLYIGLKYLGVDVEINPANIIYSSPTIDKVAEENQNLFNKTWDALSEDEKDILGKPNFVCGMIAERLRQMGFDCKRKAEDEQAVVIFTMLQFYNKHGKDWANKMNEYLKAGTIANEALNK